VNAVSFSSSRRFVIAATLSGYFAVSSVRSSAAQTGKDVWLFSGQGDQ
jgi:hypothetical protein